MIVSQTQICCIITQNFLRLTDLSFFLRVATFVFAKSFDQTSGLSGIASLCVVAVN